jgi:hypothetical protein
MLTYAGAREAEAGRAAVAAREPEPNELAAVVS